ncbi:MAG: DNA polymerase III subunit chi [Gammaproteobacteria bacterium]|jgi:DNA polymerase-3 subunit chi
MTEIDFYLIQSSRPDGRLVMVCRLAAKAYGLGHRIHIHTAGPPQSEQLDDLLWTFQDGSFVPHEIGNDPGTPVTINHAHTPEGECDVLINLAADVPAFFSRFLRVAEVLDEGTRETGRERYRFYRDRGYALRHHELKL